MTGWWQKSPMWFSIIRTRHAAERVLTHAGWRQEVPRKSSLLVLVLGLVWSGLVLDLTYSRPRKCFALRAGRNWSSLVLTLGWVQRWPRTRCWRCRGGSGTSPPYCHTPGNLAVQNRFPCVKITWASSMQTMVLWGLTDSLAPASTDLTWREK